MAGILVLEVEAAQAFWHLTSAALIYNRNTGEVTNEIAIHPTVCLTINSFLGNV